jgi:uncharacterized membrane protein YfcA
MTFIYLAIVLGFFTFINILAPVSGSATVTPVLAGLVGVKDAIAVATVFFLLTCIPRVYLFRKYIQWHLVKQLWPASIVGAVIGSVALTGIDAKIVAIIIILFLMFFLYKKLISVLKPATQNKPTSKHGVTFIGLISGALQGTGLAGSDLRNGYLYSKGLSIQKIHGTTALIGGANFLFASVVRVSSGDLIFSMMLPVFALFPLIILATYIGRHVTLKMPKKWQDILIVGIMVFALVTIIYGLF